MTKQNGTFTITDMQSRKKHKQSSFLISQSAVYRIFNLFIPEFLKSSVFEFGQKHCSKEGSQSKHNKMANNVDPDETAHNEPSHLDRHCSQKYMYLLWSTGLEGFTSL